MKQHFKMLTRRNKSANNPIWPRRMSCNRTCPVSPTLDQILTYDNCNTDIAINYALILLFQATVFAHDIPYTITAVSTLYLWAFQLVLCLLVGCVGVSVVWSAQMGILIHFRNFRSGSSLDSNSWSSLWYYFSLTSGLIAWIYYAVIEEPITTVAHICALIMGVLVDLAAQRWEVKVLSEKAKEEDLQSRLISSSN